MSQLENLNKKITPVDNLSVPAALETKRAEERKKEPISTLSTRALLEEKRVEERNLVRGIFRFHEVPGGQMDFVYRKYKGDPLEKFSMKDGEVYEVPLGVARHLNTNCWYPVYGHSETSQADVAGSALNSIKEKIRRCSFQSLDFVDTAKY